MAEFVASGTTVQTVAYRSPVILTTSIACPKGYIIHRENSGSILLRGIVNNPCQRYARYLVQYSGNIAIPEGGTVGEIALGITLNGEPIEGTLALSTPAAAEQFNSVSAIKNVSVPVGCCFTLAVENLTASQEDIDVDTNLNVVITRTA